MKNALPGLRLRVLGCERILATATILDQGSGYILQDKMEHAH
jgi:hypothetical protein